MFKKDFLSLNRGRRRPTSNGFQTINNLEDNNLRLTQSSPISSPKNSVEIQLEKSKKIRQELDSLDKNGSNKSSNIESTHALMIKDIFHKRISIGLHKLDETPRCHLMIKSLDHNGKRIQKESSSNLMINISSNGQFIFFTLGPKFIKGLTIDLVKHVKSITFSMLNRSLLIELQEGAGYVYITYITSTWDFVDQLKSIYKKNGGVEHIGTNDELLKKMRLIDSERTPNGKADSSSAPSSTNVTPTRTITPIDPSKMYGSRTTRSVSRLTGGLDPQSSPSYKLNSSDSESENVDTIQTRKDETPEPFIPSLSYKFLDSKKFTITNSDFKTLYNNDWINDSVIDFFIKYDIDQAVKNNLFKQDEIFAFNSFFFNKLMTKSKDTPSLKDGEEIVSLDKDTLPDYYGNIKRWLNKIDLMKYPYVIIPINENLHWYCCVVKGLPELLSRATKLKERMNEMDGFDFKSSEEVIKEVFRVEIFIFDSLSQKHSNIHYPLKKFIIDYCKDKYDLEITKDQFRTINARVPKQNNFNDCGIHVIYNVRKLLSDATQCERLWKSGNSLSRYQSKLFFKASERNGMRQTLRETLKRLQKEENSVSECNGNGDADEEEDIEIIEMELPKSGKEPPKKSPKAAKIRPVDDTEVLEKVLEILGGISDKHTLDPKSTSFLKTIISNKFIRRDLSGKKLSKLVVEILNHIYPSDNEIDAEELSLVADFAIKISGLDILLERKKISDEFFTFLKEKMKISPEVSTSPASPPPTKVMPTKANDETAGSDNSTISEGSRPKDETFVIKHYLDNEDLSQCVNELQISEPGAKRAKSLSSTPIKSPAVIPNSSPLDDKNNKEHYKSFPNKRRKLID